MDDQPPSAYVLARQTAAMLCVHRRSTSLLTHSSRWMQNLAALLCQRVRISNRLIINSERNAKSQKLTGAFYPRQLKHIYSRESSRGLLEGQRLVLFMLDDDHLEAYNNQHGHMPGTPALCMGSMRLASCCVPPTASRVMR